jgi:glutathione S-transferase
MSEFIVHGIPGSPFLRAVMAALEEKSASYEVKPVAPGEHRGEAYRRLHPFSRIPVMQHGDFTLYETQAILRYVDAVCPGPALQPANPKRAARMNQICGINDWYFFPQVGGPMVFQRLIGPVLLGHIADEAVIAAAQPNAANCVRVLEELLGDQAFLTGDSLTLADLLLFPQIAYFSQTPEGRALLGGTCLNGWLGRMAERPSSQATLPPEPLRQAV